MIRINHEFGQEGHDKEIHIFEDIGKLFTNDYENLPDDRDHLIKLSHEIDVLLKTLEGQIMLKGTVAELFYGISSLPTEVLNPEQSYFLEETLNQLEDLLYSL